MLLEFEDDDLQNLAYDPAHRTKRWPPEVTPVYRRRIQQLRAARSEQDLRMLRSLHLELLKGNRWPPGSRSIRINKKYRLILHFRSDGDERVAVVIDGLDYH